MTDHKNMLFLQSDDIKIECHIEYRPKRRSLAIYVYPEGRVVVKSPAHVSSKRIEAFVIGKLSWIGKTLKKLEQKKLGSQTRAQSPIKEILYLGKPYKIEEGSVIHEKSVTIENEKIFLSTDKLQTIKTMEKWFKLKASKYFNERLVICYEQFKKITAFNNSLPQLHLKSLKSKWGSLDSLKGMTLNLLLLQLPPVYIDYVINHELCHLRIKGHGKRFYNLFDKIMPDWKEIRKTMKKWYKDERFINKSSGDKKENNMEID